MAQVQTLAGNPFALMMHPDDVLQAVQRSDRLGELKRRVCRPLDRPLIPAQGDDAAVTDDFDADMDPAVGDAE